jgi:O-6-methylguanine DNA methyltransferase
MVVAKVTRNRRREWLRQSLPVPVTVDFRTLAAVETLALVPTAWGLCGVVWKNHESEGDFSTKPSNAQLCRIITPGLATPQLRRDLLKLHPGCREVMADAHGAFHPATVPDWFGALAGYLQGYYSDGLRGWTEPKFVDNWAFWRPRLEWERLTAFQKQVLEVVAGIGRGMLMTYGEVAAKIGKPSASRAVGAAIGSNPWPVLVPCHRVVGASGQMTGFSAPGGVEAKRRMLDLERVTR